MKSLFSHSIGARVACGLAAIVSVAAYALVDCCAIACPFCAVESQTLSEEIAGADVAVLAKLVKEAPTAQAPIGGVDDGVATGNATFEVVEVLRGEDKLAGAREIEVVFFGEPNREQLFLIPGISAEKLDWTTPLPLSDAAVKYVRALEGLPAAGVARLAFFQNYFEHEDPLLAQDAYDEFARAPYPDIQALGPRMHHDRIVDWIQNPEVSPSRRRLYLTMLGACGNESDLPLIEEMITSDYESKKPFVESLVFNGLAVGGPVALPTWIELINQDERRKKLGLDALVACYLVLRGPEGLDLIDAELLKNPKAEYTHIYSTIMALRFHGDDASVVPRERLLASMRLLLDNSDFADQVIIDLSRWDDWSVLDRLVAMFKSADEKGYVRQPIVTYLSVASEQEGDVGERATAALADLEEFDPESVKRAKSLMAFGFLARARAAGDGNNAARPENVAAVPGSVAEGQADAATGFAASAADVADDDQSDAVDIPDPTDYGTAESAPPPVADEPADDGANASATKEQDPAPGSEASIGANAKPSLPTESDAEIASEAPSSTFLIVGLPLAATGILMALYWWILRSGAV